MPILEPRVYSKFSSDIGIFAWNVLHTLTSCQPLHRHHGQLKLCELNVYGSEHTSDHCVQVAPSAGPAVMAVIIGGLKFR